MVLNKTNTEIIDCLTKLYQNMKKSSSPDNPLMSKYNQVTVTPIIKEELEKAYQSVGVEFKLEHTPNELFDLAYYKYISLNHLPMGINRKHLKYYKQYANRLYLMDYSKLTEDLVEYVEYGYYTETISVPQIQEQNTLWMTPVMMEYNTMKGSIDKSFGHVLTFGLGLFFYQFQCLMRDEVTSITVVERSKDVITFFEECILPQVRAVTDKEINILHADAFSYYYQDFIDRFDYVFVDIWLNNTDGVVLYAQFLNENVQHPNIDFWIEECFLNEGKKLIASYLCNYAKGSVTSLLKYRPDNFTDACFKALHKHLRSEGITLETKEDVLALINNTDLIKTIYKQAHVLLNS